MAISDFIKDFLIKQYGLSVRLKSLPGYEDLNFKATDIDGRQYVVKLMHEGCEENWIALQCSALLYLADRNLDILLPKVILSKNKQGFVKVIVEGSERILWILTYCPGYLMVDYSPHSSFMMESFGQGIASLTNGFEGFSHPHMKRGHSWELTQAASVSHLSGYIKGETKELAEIVFSRFQNHVSEQLKTLPHSVIHNDANDYNVLVDKDGKIKAVFDFGDMSFQPIICEVAIALAYATMRKSNPLEVCCQFLKGYCAVRNLSKEELGVLLDLIKTRLVISISFSSFKQLEEPENKYITASQPPAKKALKQLSGIPPKVAEGMFRHACGLPVTEHSEAVLKYLMTHGKKAVPVMKVDRLDCILDLSVASLLLGSNPHARELKPLAEAVDTSMKKVKSTFGFGRYAEPRLLYSSSLFGHGGHPTEAKRTQHIGLDIFCKAGLPVFAPFDGTVEILAINTQPLDYGGLVILKHKTDAGAPFYTLYGHLSHDTLKHLETGQGVKAGQQIANIGEKHENGNWPPHLHLQIIVDLFGLGADFPGVALQSETAFWESVCPNPALLYDVPDIDKFNGTPHPEKLLKERKTALGFNLSLSYEKPLHAVMGFGQYLYDSKAQANLDVYNNVPHVGHSHPRVVDAIQSQVALLNTNTRYLHENILKYAKMLTDEMPDGLEVCYFVNSASEANELALRLARAYTGRRDMMVVEAAYHGHTSGLIEISPYKYNGPGGLGAPDWVHEIPIADDYRGQYKRGTSNVGQLYANKIKEKLQIIEKQGRKVAAFIAETYPSVGGQIITPTGYLPAVYKHLRSHGALCIADEVQTGFGRLGDSYWAFETQNAIPDMVVLGKPIANGFPMGALVTTKEIAAAFDNGMEFFSTFGGNPVACAAARAVMEVVEEENLQANAKKLGSQFISDLRKMQEKFELIGDVRGEGFYLGIELVRDRNTLEAADKEANYVVNRLREQHILAGIDGPLHNVIKIRPSMVIEEWDMERLTTVLGDIFQETFLNS